MERGLVAGIAVRFLRSRTALVGLALLVAVAALALLAPVLATHDPIKINPRESLHPPGGAHYFGTDRFGRDVWSRVVWGARPSLQAGLLAVALAATLGIVPGLLAGYYGGWLDAWISRLVDVLLAFPGILLALAIVAMLGTGMRTVPIAIGISLTPSFLRLVRGQVLAARHNLYVEAARAAGCPGWVIIYRHLFRNIVGPIVVMATVALGWAMLIAASLNFLGMGVQPPTPDWGADLALGRDYMRSAWWISAFPGAGILLAILGVNLVGDGLRDAIDPRLQIR